MLKRISIALTALALAAPAWSQCILCREAAASQPAGAAQALNLAIVVLFAPAVGLFGTVYYVAFRGARSRDDE
jgi:hypothetical protein